MKNSFSSLDRNELLQQLEAEKYDLLVIGGGVTGAGIALDSAVRGMKVALIEMQDFAAGTSSRSTKLVHGGLRYLKQGEIGLVREVGRERVIVYENARHVVTPEWMLMPIIKGGTYGKLMSSIGIYIYDWLAGVKKEERRKMLSKEETLAKEPLLRKDGLIGGGYYVEYRTDDARLTIEIMKAAVQRGAAAINYVKAENFLYDINRKIYGVKAKDLNSGREITIQASKIVNAAGPWVDTLRELDGSKQGKRLHLTKGVHLVVDQSRFPLRQAIYFDTPDKRMVFAIPRDGKTYIGTTDTNYDGNLEHPRMTTEDRDYILKCANSMFPSIALKPEDVESSWAGLRPLIHEDGKSPSELSRKDEIFISDSGLITIAGGKLTGYRKMAERIVDLVASQLSDETGRIYPPCSTDKVTLAGGDFGGSFDRFIDEKVRYAKQLGVPEQAASRWVLRYGTNINKVFELMEKEETKQTAESLQLEPVVLAGLMYGIQEEMVTRPVDFINRRSSAVNFDHQRAQTWVRPVVVYMSQLFEWDESQIAQFEEEAHQALRFAKEAVQ